MNALSSTLTFAATVTALLTCLFIIAFTFYEHSVKGSRLRFITNSYCRILQYFVIAHCPISVTDSLIRGEYGWALIGTLAGIYFIRMVIRYRKLSEDDDDIWKRLGKKMKKVLSNVKASLPTFSPGLAPNGA